MQNQVGFSLVEVLIVLAIVSIIAVLATPSFTKYMANDKGKELAFAIASSLHRARTEARTQSSTVAVCSLAAPVPVNQTCNTFACACGNATNWNNGWIVINQSTSPNTIIAVYNTQTPVNNIQVANGAVVFSPNGFMKTSATIFTIKPTGCGQGYSVTVSYPIGHIQVCGAGNAGAGCIPPTCP